MNRVSRRALIQAGAGLAATSALRGAGQAGGAPGQSQHLVYLHLFGGMDSVLTVDPKVSGSRHLEPGYRAEERLQGRVRLYGPLLKPLLRYEEQLTLVHGVRVNTVAHPTGNRQILAGRLMYTRSTPWIFDALGAALPGSAPLPTLLLGTPSTYAFPESDPGGYESPSPILAPPPRSVARVQRPEWMDVVDRAHLAEADPLFASNPLVSRELRVRQEQIRTVSRLLERAQQGPVFSSAAGRMFRVALAAIRGNFAKCLFLRPNVACDTHANNVLGQTEALTPVFEDLARFIDLLSEEGEGGRPIQRTTLVVASELGRFPKFNSSQGKDHWPENSWILLGKGLRRAAGGVTCGQTDGDYRGMAVDFTTGRVGEGAGRPILLDSVFATLADIAGNSSARLGYDPSLVLRYILSG